MSGSGQAVTLRPGEWGPGSLGIPVLGRSSACVVLDVPPPPADVPRREAAGRLVSALRKRLAERCSPSLSSLFPSPPGFVHESPHGGPLVLGVGPKETGRLREAYGSFLWTFRFLLLVRCSPFESTVECSLPVAVHDDGTRSLISHRTGKKARTRFTRLREGGCLEMWQAETSYLRADQIRLHAVECGLAVVGENLYGNTPPLSRADLPGKRRPGGTDHVLLHGPAIHLAELEAPPCAHTLFRSRPPKPMAKWCGG